MNIRFVFLAAFVLCIATGAAAAETVDPCPPGFKLEGGMCVKPVTLTCPPGSTLNEEGACVMDAICPSGMKATEQGTCVEVKPAA